ncbi:hypothetical protein Btru_046229, partial [Bulinus truncatus]
MCYYYKINFACNINYCFFYLFCFLYKNLGRYTTRYSAVANMATSAPKWLGLTLWLLTFSSHAIGINHECEKQTEVTSIELHACCELLDWMTGKYGRTMTLIPPDHTIDLNDCSAKCNYTETKHVNSISCCDGWEGTNCDQPVCKPACTNGGICRENNTCICPEGFGGRACQENIQNLEKNRQYCYKDESCQEVVSSKVMNISDCCIDGYAGSWGSQLPGYGCKQCIPETVIQTTNKLDYVSCMTSFDSFYRTFNGATFNYQTSFAVGLLLSSTLDMYATTHCDPLNQCTCSKNVTIFMKEPQAMNLTLQDKILTLTDGETSKTYNASQLTDNTPTAIDDAGSIMLKISQAQNTVYVLISRLKCEIRLENDGTFVVTLKRDSIIAQNFSGICGERANSEPERIFEKFIHRNLPRGDAIHPCLTPEEDTNATRACKPIDKVFHRCHDQVNPAYYNLKCKDSYCTSLRAGGVSAAEKAACNVMSAYDKACTLKTGNSTNWRSKNLCAKSCPNNQVYNGLLTNKCPLTCGIPLIAYAHSNCQTLPYGGCTCEPGMAISNGTCVPYQDCPCSENGRLYKKGDRIVLHCKECECGSFGVWSCHSTSSCMADCDVLDGRYFKTFDNKMFATKGLCEEHTLVQGNDPLINVSITLQLSPSYVKENEDFVGPCKLIISYQGITSSININGTSATIENGLPSKIYGRQVGKNVYVISAIDKQIQVKMFSCAIIKVEIGTAIFSRKVFGICGYMDNNKGNDLMSLSYSQVNGIDFLQLYSKCDTAQYSELITTTMDSSCNQVNDPSLISDERIDLDVTKRLCHYASTENKQCVVLENLALSSNNYAAVFNNTACTGSVERRIYTDICDANCGDSTLFPNCESELLFIETCRNGELYSQNGTCVPRNQCGCYIKGGIRIEPNDLYTDGNYQCVCIGNKMICEKNYGEEDIACASNQLSRADLLLNASDPQCLGKRCPNLNSNEDQCITLETSSQLCYCAGNLKQTMLGECVKHCPCLTDDGPVNHGEKIEQNCQSKTCKDGHFEYETSDKCYASCVIIGHPMSVKTFDSPTLSDSSINGLCVYHVMSIDGCSITLEPQQCYAKGKVCNYKITIQTHLSREPLTLVSSNPGIVMAGGKEYVNDVGPNITITSVGPNTAINFNSFSVISDGGTTLTIVVSKDLINKTSGLCGKFDLNSLNDNVGSDNWPKPTLHSLADSWVVNRFDCTSSVEETTDNYCKDSIVKESVERACRIISEGAVFKRCREKSENLGSYYRACIEQGCSCDPINNCGCTCDVISAAAFYCKNELGENIYFRSRSFCAMQCEVGEIYQIGSIHRETCGKPLNSTPSSIPPFIDGCFCQNGFVLSVIPGSKYPTCIRKSDCPCQDKLGGSIFPGQTVTIDCQPCECKNGTLTCTGDRCAKPCNQNEYNCHDGKCISGSLVCNGVPDCKDKRDELNCTECQGYKCLDGQCISNTSVCDQKIDCLDSSDENYNCTLNCTEGYYKCPESMICILQEFLCDGYKDCPYGEDEMNCKVCPRNETHCNQSYCIPKNFNCDGHDDCGDGSDEVGCTYPLTTTLKECQNKYDVLNKPGKGLSIESSSGIAQNAFTSIGWFPQSGNSDSLKVIVDEKTEAFLNKIEFVVQSARGTTLLLDIYTEKQKNIFQ